jgi:hypothetical protein
LLLFTSSFSLSSRLEKVEEQQKRESLGKKEKTKRVGRVLLGREREDKEGK